MISRLRVPFGAPLLVSLDVAADEGVAQLVAELSKASSLSCQRIDPPGKSARLTDHQRGVAHCVG